VAVKTELFFKCVTLQHVGRPLVEKNGAFVEKIQAVRPFLCNFAAYKLSI